METIDRGAAGRRSWSANARRSASATRAAGSSREEAKGSLLFGVPMNWMTRWPGDHPVFVDRAEGAHFWDVDGNEFVDLCLGDTGGMAGHSPKIARRRDRRAGGQGHHADAADRGRHVGRHARWRGGSASRTGSSRVTATDANRFVIRWAREITGAPEDRRAQLVLPRVGRRDVRDARTRRRTVAREGNIGKPVPLDETTRVVEINDLEGLEARPRARRRGGVPVRARAHEHRHRAARPRLPRGGARAVHEVRHAADDRRDPHDQRRARAVARRRGASSPTSSRSARRSAPGSRAAPTA